LAGRAVVSRLHTVQECRCAQEVFAAHAAAACSAGTAALLRLAGEAG
jgi:hypothetical protein